MAGQSSLNELVRRFFQNTFLQRTLAHGFEPLLEALTKPLGAQNAFHALGSTGGSQRISGRATR